MFRRVGLSHQKVKRNGQNGGVSVLLRVTCHQKKQQYYDQIPGVKILGQQLPQKACVMFGVFTGRRIILYMAVLCVTMDRRWGRGSASVSWGIMIRDTVSCIRSIRLGNISVIHCFHLPNRFVARPAIFAARIARSSLATR